MTIQEILKSCNYPTDVLVIDFETATDKDYSLKKMSTVEYIKDERFRVLGCAVKYNEQPAQFLTDFRERIVFSKYELGWPEFTEGVTIICHNAFFDCGILAWRYGIYPNYIIDTLSLARHVDSRNRNDLNRLAKRLKIGEKLPMPVADAPIEKWNKYACNDAELEYRVFEKLLPMLSNPQVELPLIHHTIELYTKPQLQVDFDRSSNLRSKMLTEMGNSLAVINEERKTISGNKSFVALLQNALGDEPIPMKRGKNGLIPGLAKDDEGLKKLLNHANPRVKDLVKARIAVKSWPLHIKRVEGLEKQARVNDGRLPIALKYYGAHTGRWSGTEGINPQNFGARSKEELINRVGSVLIAPPGYVLVITDASQIEARIVNWLAGQTDVLQEYVTGDPYSKLASRIVGREITKTDRERQLGKCVELGSGFGMGAAKLMVMAKKPPYEIDLPPIQAERAIQTYRTTHPKVCTLWYNVEQLFRRCILSPVFESWSLGIDQFSDMRFGRQNKVITIRLPSGRVLYYHKIKLRVEQNKQEIVQLNATDDRKSVRLWGGYLVENIVQAIARDVLAVAVLETDRIGQRIGQRVALHVHDSIVSVVPKEHAEQALAIQLSTLRKRPEWAKTLPLDAEGYISERYE